MQGWRGCKSLSLPTSLTGYTQGLILTDVRDNKQYEIRKFIDGKCWMVENLRYGGDTDNCNGKTTFNGNGSATPSNQFGPGTYGDCRDPRAGGSAPCTAGSTVCGYLYNWQGVMQHATAYYNSTYVGPSPNVQGICPDGWRLPTSDTGGDFDNLHTLAGSPATGFWQLLGSWKGVFSGYCNPSGSFSLQGSGGYWWSSAFTSKTNASCMYLRLNAVNPSYNSYKSNGFSVRCIKN